MARSITEIQQAILDKVQADATLSAKLTNTSSTAIWKLWTFIVAACQWTLETLFDQHKAEITGIIDNLKPHSLRWYANMAMAFEYGQALVQDEDYYDNSALTDDQIEASKIVAYAAVVGQEKNLRVKVAKITDGDLAPLADDEKAAFVEYMDEIKDAGVKLVIDSLPADSLKLWLRIFYNPLVLDASGARLDGTAGTPVQDAINAYLKELPFNGTLAMPYLVDALQLVDGVILPVVDQAQATHGELPYDSIDVTYNPDAGYLRILAGSDLQITFIPQSPIK